MKQKFYIEYYNRKSDGIDAPIADTFHIEPKSLPVFMKTFMKTGKRVVHLQALFGKGQIIFSKRRIGQR